MDYKCGVLDGYFGLVIQRLLINSSIGATHFLVGMSGCVTDYWLVIFWLLVENNI